MVRSLRRGRFIRLSQTSVELAARLKAIHRSVKEAESRYGRLPQSVSLLAVSKGQPVEAIVSTYQLGQRAFAESYVQEAAAKIALLPELPLEWHFIGPIQSNKTKRLAALFSWVHSVDRKIIAARLSRQRPEALPSLNVCVQLKINELASQSGVGVDEFSDLMKCVDGLPRLKLRGIMAMAPREKRFDRQRSAFARVREVYERFRDLYALDTLSMGMSYDFTAAIAEHASMIRIGRALFGPRS